MKRLVWSAVLVALLAGSLAAEESVVVFDGSYKLVNRGSDHVYWAWKATVSNREDVARDLRLKVQLIDSSGFELGRKFQKIHIGPVQVGTFTGHGMMKNELWEKVAGANFTVE